MTVFCDIAPCSLVELTDVSEVLTASIIRAMNQVLNVQTAYITPPPYRGLLNEI
jgi:hypothetical protein